MFYDWKSMLANYRRRGDEFADLTPSTRIGFRKLHAAAEETAQLEPKMQELIAVAVAITTRSDGCIANHIRLAIKYGATRAEIAEALGIAVAMNAGVAMTYSMKALDAFEVFDADNKDGNAK